jgi:hypothetical protein
MHEIEPFLGKHGEIANLWEQVASECKKRNPTLFREFNSRNAKFRLEAYKNLCRTCVPKTKETQETTTNNRPRICWIWLKN